MPSGSHGGGGGHSGGGSHFSGGHGGGSHFSGGHGGGFGGGPGFGGGGFGGRPPRPISFHFGGRHYYIPAGRGSAISSAVLAFFVLLIFSIFIGFAMFSTMKDINLIKADRQFYIGLINRAEDPETNNKFIKDGVIYDIQYSQEAGKWRFLYKIEADEGDNAYLFGYTYFLYSYEDAEYYWEHGEYRNGYAIKFAVDTEIVNSKKTASVDLGYKDLPLSADGEYMTLKSTMTFLGVFEGVIVLAVVICVVSAIKKFKQIAEVTDSSNQTKATTSTTNTSASTTVDGFSNTHDDYTYCMYCGSKIDKGSKKCSNCGSSQR